MLCFYELLYPSHIMVIISFQDQRAYLGFRTSQLLMQMGEGFLCSVSVQVGYTKFTHHNNCQLNCHCNNSIPSFQNAKNKIKQNIPCFSEKNHRIWRYFLFFLEFFWPHLDYAFSVVRVVKTSLNYFFRQALKICCNFMINPSWDVSQWSNIQNFEKKKKSLIKT